MLTFFKNTLIDLDSYGHTFEWSFKERQGQYKTKLGGGITVILTTLLSILAFR